MNDNIISSTIKQALINPGRCFDQITQRRGPETSHQYIREPVISTVGFRPTPSLPSYTPPRELKPKRRKKPNAKPLWEQEPPTCSPPEFQGSIGNVLGEMISAVAELLKCLVTLDSSSTIGEIIQTVFTGKRFLYLVLFIVLIMFARRILVALFLL